MRTSDVGALIPVEAEPAEGPEDLLLRRCLVAGAIGVVELEERVDMSVVQPAFVEEGVWVRPFGRLVYLMPPFIIEQDDVEALTAAVCRVVDRLGGKAP